MTKAQTSRKKVLKTIDRKRSPRLSREEIAEAMKSVATARNRIHVIAYEGKWGVLRAGSKRMSKVKMDKRRAIAYARRLAKKKAGTSIVIHKEDGSPEKYLQTD